MTRLLNRKLNFYQNTAFFSTDTQTEEHLHSGISGRGYIRMADLGQISKYDLIPYNYIICPSYEVVLTHSYLSPFSTLMNTNAAVLCGTRYT